MRTNHAPAVFAACFLTGCGGLVVGPDYTAPEVQLPARWNSSGGNEKVSRTWWSAFGDPELNRLEALALHASPDMAKALARVEEARASLRETMAARFPSVTASGGVSRSQQSANVQQIPGFRPQAVTDYRQQADLNFEIDLWGKIRRSTEAARAQVDAVAFNGQAVRLRLTAQVAENYFTMRGLEAEMLLLEEALKVRGQSLDLVRQRQSGGLSDKLDVSRSETELAGVQAELTDLRRRHALSLHALAALCGQPATGFHVSNQSHRIPAFAAQSPASLLRQRPDIAEAERGVAARSAEIGVAEAARRPGLTLNGNVGLESLSLGDLLGSGSGKFSFGPRVELPIFDAGARKSKVEQARARHAEALGSYRATVLTALKEAEDALTDTRGYAALAGDFAAATAAAEKTAVLSLERYKGGVANYLEVIDAERELLSNKRREVQALTLQALAAARLAKAFGGGGIK